MNKKKIIILCLLLFVSVIYIVINNTAREPEPALRVREVKNGSRGSFFENSLSNDHVIRETRYYEKQGISPLSTYQYWEYEQIGTGEVTIYWRAYESGNQRNEEESYEVTYLFDEKGKYKIIHDSRKE